MMRNLGRTQQLVLHLLASGGKTVETLAYDWPTLTESSVGNALGRLARRGLVDRQNPHGAYEWYLTDKGRAVEAELVGADDDA